MGVGIVGGNWLAGLFSQLYQIAGNPLTVPGTTGASTGSADDLRETYRMTLGLRKAIQELQQALRHSHPYPGHALPVSADSSLTLVPTTYTTLTGMEEVNATPTSFSPFGPSWRRGSTSLADLTGIYNGIDGTALQKVRVITGGTVGGSSALELRASVGSKIENITIPARTPANTPITLSNGIILRLSAGTLVKNDEIDINLYSTVGSVVDPNKPFNGVRQNYPNFQYGLNITGGSFTVNGVSISVAATDTLNQVLARITSSAAGVTAVFDTATESVRLTQKTPGPEPIALGNDTSGFLTATKLAGATPIPGSDEQDTPLARVPKLSGITTGLAYINDVPISVDTQVDSLDDVLARINASSAGVSASIVDGQVRITSGAAFVLRDGTSELFKGLGIAEGGYGSRTPGGVAGSKSVVDAMEQVSLLMNGLFDSASLPATVKSSLRQAFLSIAAGAFHKTGPQFDSGLGVRMDFTSGASEIFRFSEKDRTALIQALRNRPVTLKKLFLSSISEKGENFLDLLSRQLLNVESGIKSQLGGTGVLLDISA